jgi:hypothetical protein
MRGTVNWAGTERIPPYEPTIVGLCVRAPTVYPLEKMSSVTCETSLDLAAKRIVVLLLKGCLIYLFLPCFLGFFYPPSTSIIIYIALLIEVT